jgi:hypothetical protein
MREDHAHCTSVQDSLDETVSALIWYPDKRRDPCQKTCGTELTCIIYGQSGVFQINEEGVETGLTGDLNHCCRCDELDPECLSNGR